MAQRVVISGASGLIGTALASTLTSHGVEVVKLVRRAPASPNEITWSPGDLELDPGVLEDANAVVNLCGAGVADRRWSAAYRTELLESRVEPTATLARALSRVDRPVRVVNGSAVGIYGSDRGNEILTEESTLGDTFLAQVVESWEAETLPMSEAGHPVALLRSGIVLDGHGGALAKMLPLAKAGLGGPLGSGQQFWSWIALDDEVAAIIHLIDHPQITGPVNATAPEPTRQRDVAAALGTALGRPAIVPTPALALRLVLDGFAGEILGSQRVIPRVLQTSGFTYRHPTIADAMDWITRD